MQCYSIFTFLSLWECDFAMADQISSHSTHPQQSYDVISIFQDGSSSVANLLIASGLVRAFV